MTIIVLGDPVDGFRYIGPFVTSAEAMHHAELAHPNDTWWVVDLEDQR